MASRLSSLLVRDGLVGVRRMEKAFQRQVIDGGGLDTILLELGLVTEDRLTQYLALAAGVPPATHEELGAASAEAVARVPRALAERTRAVPRALVAEGLRVLVCEPVELPLLEQLADELDLGIQPVIVPEFRWQLALAQAYGWPAPARYAALAAQLESDAGLQPVGRARTVIVDEALVVPVPVPVPATPGQVLAPIAADAPTARLTAPMEAAMVPPMEAAMAALVAAAPPVTARVPTPIEVARRNAEWGDTPLTDPDARALTLAVVEARARLGGATQRDQVWAALLDGVRGRAAWAGIFTVQAGVATGRRAAADAGYDVDAISALAVPVAAVPAMQRAVQKQLVQVAPLASGDDGVDALLTRLGATLTVASMVLPVVLGSRVVALVVAHRGAIGLGLADIAEILPLAGMAADALSRIIAQQKAADAPLVDPATALIALLDQVEAGDDDAFYDALERAPELMPLIDGRFPGKLRTTRYQLAGRPLRAGQHGQLLELLVQIGTPALGLLRTKMTDADRDVRYYATACVAELRPVAAIGELIARVFDADFGVRGAAIEALAGYPRRDVGPSLTGLRRALADRDDERASAAADAITALLDVGAVDDLLDAIDADGRRGEAVRRALVHLTRQDFGTAGKRWRAWWSANSQRHRIEWLIDALTHKDDTLRQAAAGELRRITGESHGYADDQARRERETAISRWRAWWTDIGRARFTS